MIKEERQNKILDLLDQNGFLNVSNISEELNVSEMTIRRDLNQLEKENLLIKVHGGAKKRNFRELSTDEKINNYVSEKREIGQIMNSIIPNDSVIYLGAGTTIFYALSELNKENLFIITNSLITFDYLTKNTNYKIILTGGEFNHTTEEFIGNIAEKAFLDLNIDIAFAATNGILDNNITTSSSLQGGVQNAAFKKAKIKCIVADHSKLDKSDIYTFCKLSDMDYLITDKNISDKKDTYYSKYTTVLKEVQHDFNRDDESIYWLSLQYKPS